MSERNSFYRTQFNKHLDPIKTMLSWKRTKSSREKWLEFVENTKRSVMMQPEQYLGRDLPAKEIIERLVREIFDDFLAKETN